MSTTAAVSVPPSILAAMASHTLTRATTTKDGFSYTTTVALTDWVKATDAAMTAAAWQAVGGTGDWNRNIDASGTVKENTGDHVGEYGGEARLAIDQSAVVFAKVTIQNTTASFALAAGVAREPRLDVGWTDDHLTHTESRAACADIPGSSAMYCRQQDLWYPATPAIPAGESLSFGMFIIDGRAFSPADPNGAATTSQVLILGDITQGGNPSTTVSKMW